MPSPGGAPPNRLNEGGIHADDLALATSAREPQVIHDAQDIDMENGSGTLMSGEEPQSKSLNEKDDNGGGKADAVPSIDAEQEGGKYGVRAVIGGFGISLCTWGMSAQQHVGPAYALHCIARPNMLIAMTRGMAEPCLIASNTWVRRKEKTTTSSLIQ